MALQIFIIHRSDIIRQGLQQILQQPGWEVRAVSGYEELASYRDMQSNWLLLLAEVALPRDSELIRTLHKQNTVILVGIAGEKAQEPAQRDFFQGEITLDTPAEKILSAIKELLSDDEKDAHHEGETLSNREKDVLKLVALGYSNKEIADQLFISIHTVISHRKNITEKLGIKSISGLTVYAIINKLIDTGTIHPEQLI